MTLKYGFLSKAGTALIALLLAASMLVGCGNNNGNSNNGSGNTSNGTTNSSTSDSSSDDDTNSGDSDDSSDDDNSKDDGNKDDKDDKGSVTAGSLTIKYLEAMKAGKYYQETKEYFNSDEKSTDTIKVINACDGDKFCYISKYLDKDDVIGAYFGDRDYTYTLVTDSRDNSKYLLRDKRENQNNFSINYTVGKTSIVTLDNVTYYCVDATLTGTSNGKALTENIKFYYTIDELKLKYTYLKGKLGNEEVSTSAEYYDFKTDFDEAILDPTKLGLEIYDGKVQSGATEAQN